MSEILFQFSTGARPEHQPEHSLRAYHRYASCMRKPKGPVSRPASGQAYLPDQCVTLIHKGVRMLWLLPLHFGCGSSSTALRGTAFWLRSSVVSVLISLIADTGSIAPYSINLIPLRVAANAGLAQRWPRHAPGIALLFGVCTTPKTR